jgi:hypothetical protein
MSLGSGPFSYLYSLMCLEVGNSRRARCRPASMLVGVARLAYPEMLTEIEGTAVA